MRTIGVVTVARSDFGMYRPILSKIQEDHELRLHLIVGGMHLAPEFGLTVTEIEAEGFTIGARVDMLLSSDTPEGIAKAMGLGTIGFAQAYASWRPDLLLVLGDRFEMHAAVVAAVPFNIPVAHIGGGERTEGAFDDVLRHSITKLSHLHFVTTQEYARRVVQMGEEPWRVVMSGAPSLDQAQTMQRLKRAELAARYGLRVDGPLLLVTYHPVTREYEYTEWQVRELLEALRVCELPIVFTAPNADTNGRLVQRLIKEFVATVPRAQYVAHLGTQGYFSLMAIAAAMVGNSSSGIIEAGSFGLPVVNIGTRQQGRVRGEHVIDAGYGRDDITQGIQRALSREFRSSLQGFVNPYGDGHASDRIVQHLKAVSLDAQLLTKRWADPAQSVSEDARVFTE